MQLESNEAIPGEPEDGWQKGPDLQGTEILSLALCKFTGERIHGLDEPCPYGSTHPDEPCITLYHSATALLRGEIDITHYPADVPVVEVRASGDEDPIARPHV